MLRPSDISSQESSIRQLLTDRFRCQDDVGNFAVAGDFSPDAGYFRLGPDVICYGQCSSGRPAECVTDPLHDAQQHVAINAATVQLPFDPAQVVDNLRRERYVGNGNTRKKTLPAKSMLQRIYYLARPFLPIAMRKYVQRIYLRGWDRVPFPVWPVDRTVDNLLEQLLGLALKSRNREKVPFIWFWPEGFRSCTMVTHDVETSSGVGFSSQLMDLNDSFGIKASFQIVPEERYSVTRPFLESIRNRGFEINIHDFNHDGRLFSDREEFSRRAERINGYGKSFGALGFRSAVMYRNVDWYEALDFSYDMSVPTVAHLDPQRGGCCTVMPYFINGILELPLTTTQDYTLFHILNEYSIDLWKRQISLIQEKHGLISFIAHPDYLIDTDARRVYVELLKFLLQLRKQGLTWISLPGEVNAWWRARSQMKLVSHRGGWKIEGPESERARLAFATLKDARLVYELAGASA